MNRFESIVRSLVSLSDLRDVRAISAPTIPALWQNNWSQLSDLLSPRLLHQRSQTFKMQGLATFHGPNAQMLMRPEISQRRLFSTTLPVSIYEIRLLDRSGGFWRIESESIRTEEWFQLFNVCIAAPRQHYSNRYDIINFPPQNYDGRTFL